jgi:hypothetical protein
VIFENVMEHETTIATPERVQTGVRMEKKLVKVLKALAELYDLSLGEFLENLVLTSFAGKKPFSEPSLSRIADLMRIYELLPTNPAPTPKG